MKNKGLLMSNLMNIDSDKSIANNHYSNPSNLKNDIYDKTNKSALQDKSLHNNNKKIHCNSLHTIATVSSNLIISNLIKNKNQTINNNELPSLGKYKEENLITIGSIKTNKLSQSYKIKGLKNFQEMTRIVSPHLGQDYGNDDWKRSNEKMRKVKAYECKVKQDNLNLTKKSQYFEVYKLLNSTRKFNLNSSYFKAKNYSDVLNYRKKSKSKYEKVC